MKHLFRTDRRKFIAGLSSLPALGAAANESAEPASQVAPNYFAELGVKPFINAIGPYSSLGGAEMWPQVIEAMEYAARNKARMSELHDAVGKRLAQLTGAPAAMVTSGATGAIILGTAACMTMGDETKMARLPLANDMPHEVIMLKQQRYLYDRSIRAPGAKLVEVETAADIAAAVSEKTAMFFYLQNRPEALQIEVDTFISLAKEYNIPIMCDAATTVPPVSSLLSTIAAGFDLVCYSGGKGLRGPYSAGLLLGREDLVGYARLNGSPHHRAYGRSMKVSAEEYLGMLVAVEVSLAFDEEAEFARQFEVVTAMADALGAMDGVETVTQVPGAEAREPYVEVRWDERKYPISVAAMKQALRDGSPSIEVRALFLSGGQLHLTAVMLKEGEPRQVTDRISDILARSVQT